MSLFGKKEQKEIIELQDQLSSAIQSIKELNSKNESLSALLTPELKEIDEQQKRLKSINEDISQLEATNSTLKNKAVELQNSIQELTKRYEAKERSLRVIGDEILAEEFGLYRPVFDFANSSQYKDALSKVRDEQRQQIKLINESAKQTQWNVNGNVTKGRQMVGQTTRLLMRAFNNECDELIGKVKFSNIDRTIEQIKKASASISKLGSVLGISIPDQYVHLKIKEAHLAYEYAKAKEKEKEAIREAKEREKEERRVQKEIDEQRKKLQKEQKQYQQALKDIKDKIKSASEEELDALRKKEQELIDNLDEVQKGIEDVDYREANLRAGYVYIISNVGSFGEDIYKIGMTRRLEPMDRIRELGDASVPFNFDVHALIFSDDAPALETALHHEFEHRKVNLVNQRREFFHCSLDEIKNAVLKNYDKTVEFIDFPDAEQFRLSEKMRSAFNE